MNENRKINFPKLILSFSLIIFLNLILYHRTLNSYFISDDYEWWKLVKGLNFFDSLRLFLPASFGGIVHPEFAYYRPLVAWTVWFNTNFLPMTPLVFHSTNLFFHLVNVFLVGFLGYLFFGSYWVAFLAGLFFSVFPFHSEAVNYVVSGRYNLLMTIFYLLSLISFFNYQKTKVMTWLVITWITFFLALLSLESAITFPLSVLLLILFLRKEKKFKNFHPSPLFFFGLTLILLVYFLFRSLALKTINPFVKTGYMADFFLSRPFIIYLVLLITLIIIRFLALNRRCHEFFKKEQVLWFLFLLVGVFFLPTATIPTQERHLYLPSTAGALFLSGFFVSLISLGQKKLIRSFAIIVVVLVTLFSAFWLYQKNENWRVAGESAYQITRQLVFLFAKKPGLKVVYLINFPDSNKGAYIYRVREKEAVKFMSKKTPPELIFTPKTIGLKSTVSIINQRTIKVYSQNGFIFFKPTINKKGQLIIKTPFYQATQIDKQTLIINFLLKDFNIEQKNVYFFKNGEVLPLN